MLKIHAIHGTSTASSKQKLEQVKDIWLENFPELKAHCENLEARLNKPFAHGYRSVLLVAEDNLGIVKGFALILHMPKCKFGFLDYIAVRETAHGRGVGSTVYEAVREYFLGVGYFGVFCEVEPDEDLSQYSAEKKTEIRRRLKFYEQYGARPIINTIYNLPVGDPPTRAFLLFDNLVPGRPLSRKEARSTVRYILTYRFSNVTSPSYVNSVVNSFKDDPVQIREAKYVKNFVEKIVLPGRIKPPYTLISSNMHSIHHVQSRGYIERPVRVEAMRKELSRTGLFEMIEPDHFSDDHILAVHNKDLVQYLKTVCLKLSPDRPVYPDTFPVRPRAHKPKDLAVQAGYYCIDTGTPLDRNAYSAARSAVDVAMTAARLILKGNEVVYALTRPPGHHAERRTYGGFCYFNNAAIAANYLSKYGRVSMLDIDFHHGNGAQDIFYERSDVLTVSIHGHPDTSYPYFSGFEDERGDGSGYKYNLNFPLKPGTDDMKYLNKFNLACDAILAHKTDYLVLCMGFDILKGDPTGTFNLTTRAFELMAVKLAELRLPLLITQEGGYSIRNLRRGSAVFFTALAKSQFNYKPTKNF